MLHDCVRTVSVGHAWPPFAAGVAITRVDCCTPDEPHVETLHCPKSVQLPMTQSTGAGAVVGCGVRGSAVGQAAVLQMMLRTFCSAAGHAWPPLAAGVATERVE